TRARGRTSSSWTPGRSATRTGSASAPTWPSRRGWWPSRASRSTTASTPGARWSGWRSASEKSSWRTPRAAWPASPRPPWRRGKADMDDIAEIGVIGGSGFYSLAENAREVALTTPYGEPSDPLTVAEIAGRRVAFLPRHGRDHRYPPHRINYRANLWALRSIGVRQILAPCAVGSFRQELGPGVVVVPDQLVDRTSG